MEQGAAAAAIRDESSRHEPALQEQYSRLLTHRLPGAEVLGKALEQVRAIRSGSEQSAIVAFNGCHSELKEAIKRAAQLDQVLTDPTQPRERFSRKSRTLVKTPAMRL